MTCGAAQTCSPDPSTVAAQYETLRMAALGEALPPEARSGLMLFLRRGMWGWAQALAAASAPAQPIRSPSSSSTMPPHPSSAVVHLFAAMVVNAKSRSVQ
jgi:hypothetical protein